MKKLLTIGLLMTVVILTGCSKTETTDDTTAVVIPDGCTNRFDGCNNCSVEDGKPLACTKMFCETPAEAKCTEFVPVDEKEDVETPVIPENCVSWYDGCNNCSVKDGKTDACTMMYCETPQTPKCLKFK